MLRAFLALCLLAGPALADWTVDPAASTVSFLTVKNGDTAETHLFKELSGSVSDAGAAEIMVTLASVSTAIDIRDERMREILFKVADFPLARVSAQIDMAALEGLAPGARSAVEAEITVAANGREAAYDAVFNVTRVAEGVAVVTTARAIPVLAEDLGYDVGVEALREVAGLNGISHVVPVTVDLLLRR